jgi:response regulator RpfG family c-di-GMP phosphodiesterase
MKKTIFMVDDDKDFLDSQKVILTHHNFQVETCSSSATALEKAEEINPDLVILDVNMEKEFSGFELHQKIRQNHRLKHVPIIMLTGIVTYSISHHLIDFYREMRTRDDFEISKVLRIGDGEKDLAIEYFDEDGNAVVLPLDGFVSKSDVHTKLLSEVLKFLG